MDVRWRDLPWRKDWNVLVSPFSFLPLSLSSLPFFLPFLPFLSFLYFLYFLYFLSFTSSVISVLLLCRSFWPEGRIDWAPLEPVTGDGWRLAKIARQMNIKDCKQETGLHSNLPRPTNGRVMGNVSVSLHDMMLCPQVHLLAGGEGSMGEYGGRCVEPLRGG